LLRAALRNPANELVGFLLQQAATRFDQSYQPKPGESWKGSFPLQITCLFGSFTVWRNYYYDSHSKQGHHPADAALGLEGACTPALTRLICMEGADENSFQKAQTHLKETGAIEIEARQIQRIIQQVGPAAAAWAKRDEKPEPCDAPIMYVSADGTGVPMRKAELAGRKGKQPDGAAKTQQSNLGCVFTQHTRDEKGRPMRDYNSTTYVGGMDNVEDLGLNLRREALRRGSATAGKVVVLIDGSLCLETLGKINFPGCLQIVDFYHAMEHLDALDDALLSKTHPDHKKQYRRWTKLLLKNGVEKIIAQAREQSSGQERAPRRWKRRSNISCATWHGCSMEPFAKRDTSSDRESSKPDAGQSLAHDANNRACSGQRQEPQTSCPCAASSKAASGMPSGKNAPTISPPLTIASPWLPE
jgi:hypothetical protein